MMDAMEDRPLSSATDSVVALTTAENKNYKSVTSYGKPLEKLFTKPVARIVPATSTRNPPVNNLPTTSDICFEDGETVKPFELKLAKREIGTFDPTGLKAMGPDNGISVDMEPLGSDSNCSWQSISKTEPPLLHSKIVSTSPQLPKGRKNADDFGQLNCGVDGDETIRDSNKTNDDRSHYHTPLIPDSDTRPLHQRQPQANRTTSTSYMNDATNVPQSPHPSLKVSASNTLFTDDGQQHGVRRTPMNAADGGSDEAGQRLTRFETIALRKSNNLPKCRSLFSDPVTVSDPVDGCSSPSSSRLPPLARADDIIDVSNSIKNTSDVVSAFSPEPDQSTPAASDVNCSEDWLHRGSGEELEDNNNAATAATVRATASDFTRVELFFQSLATRVFVARSTASLYISRTRVFDLPDALPSAPAVCPRKLTNEAVERTSTCDESDVSDWTCVGFGIPVFVLDTGDGRRRRRLSVVLAEQLTGFIVWRQTIDHLTEYRRSMYADSDAEEVQGTDLRPELMGHRDDTSKISPSYIPGKNSHDAHHEASLWHTMRLTADHSRTAAFHFDDATAAYEFLGVLKSLTADPDDPLLDVSHSNVCRKKIRRKLDKKNNRKKMNLLPISKGSISVPCCFTHVTRLTREDAVRRLGLQSNCEEL